VSGTGQPALAAPRDVTVVGGGMITADLLLPCLYHLQRTGGVGRLAVSALTRRTVAGLAADRELARAFPGQGFTAHPPAGAPEDEPFPELYREALRGMPPRQVVVVAVPDPLHHAVVMEALRCGQHVICVKPLALTTAHAREIREAARERGLFVGVEYHKRFDRRSLVARRAYREGRFGSFVFGEATLMEPYSYRRSNFQSWFTTDATDPFTYIGCHYVDLVSFITGLSPVEVSLQGVTGRFPNGSTGYMWSAARVGWENGALLSVTNGLGYPDDAAGANNQGMLLYCEGNGRSGMIRHDDHDRGVSHSYAEAPSPGAPCFRYVSPDFFRLVPWEGAGLAPVGYGHDSVAALVAAVREVEAAGEACRRAASGGGSQGAGAADCAEALRGRREAVTAIDDRGLLATPGNSESNEAVIQAARQSIREGGRPVRIPGIERPPG
jgi:D-galacturonate reductase